MSDDDYVLFKKQATPITSTRALNAMKKDEASFISGASRPMGRKRTNDYDPLNTLHSGPMDTTFDHPRIRFAREASFMEPVALKKTANPVIQAPIRVSTREDDTVRLLPAYKMDNIGTPLRVMDSTPTTKRTISPTSTLEKTETLEISDDDDDDHGAFDEFSVDVTIENLTRFGITVGFPRSQDERLIRLRLGRRQAIISGNSVNGCIYHGSLGRNYVDMDLKHFDSDLLDLLSLQHDVKCGLMRLSFAKDFPEQSWATMLDRLQIFCPNTNLEDGFKTYRPKRRISQSPSVGRPPMSDASKIYASTRKPSARLLNSTPRIKSKEDGDDDGGLEIMEMPNKQIRFLFNYPEGEDASSICLTSAERDRLKPGVFLNDTLIDFDIMRTISKLEPTSLSRIHTFNCFFYKRLISKKPVDRFTRNLDIFSKDLVFVPINEALHWYLGVIVNPAFALQASRPQDVESGPEICVSDDDEPPKYSHVVILDSLGHTRSAAIDALKRFMIEEAAAKHGVQLEKGLLRGRNLKVPRQPNLTDCGLFLLEMVERALRDIDVILDHFVDSDSNLSSWFAPEAASRRRATLLEEMDRLAAEFRERHPQEFEEPAPIDSSDIEIIIPNRTSAVQ